MTVATQFLKYELIEIDGNIPTQDIPIRAKWELTIGGRALSPGQVMFYCISPLIFALSAITGGAVTSTFVAALEVAGAITLGGIVSATDCIVVGAAVGGLTVSTAELMSNIYQEVSDKMFVEHFM